LPCATATGSSTAVLAIGKSPVGEPVGNQLPVRHDHFRAVGFANDAGANANAFDDTRGIADLYDVADADGALEKQNQTGNEIVEYILQTESDADAERANENRHLGHVESQRGNGNEKADENN
jgi:hypothetical protein